MGFFGIMDYRIESMSENRTKSALLDSIERYRAASGCSYREAWAAWFDGAGLTGFVYPPPPPAARPGPFARAASMLARLNPKRPAARPGCQPPHARRGPTPPDLARVASTARSGGRVQRAAVGQAGRITDRPDPGESRIHRARPLTRRQVIHGSALALALAVSAWAFLQYRQIWRWQRRICELPRAIESRGGTDGQ